MDLNSTGNTPLLEEIPLPQHSEPVPERAQQMGNLQKQLDYFFQKQVLLAQALTHRSFLQDRLSQTSSKSTLERQQHNERLEFLGDAVLELAISDLLFHLFPEQSEGQLSHWRSLLVNSHTLARIAKQLRLGQLLHLGRGERLSGGAEKSSVLGNALEALLGAIYLDGGYQAVFAVIEGLFAQHLQQCRSGPRKKDYKSLLQEHLQGIGLPLPVYQVLQIDGPDHARLFQVACMVQWQKSANDSLQRIGSGSSKRSAEQAAAQAIYQALQQTQDQQQTQSGSAEPTEERFAHDMEILL
ncbi:ribonuclease III [Candidatus Magnetaquicoccus inordinatus]|uniref:ribonuclease III n=1 Tax=Candidatus Magnetaquicoccus inordinatus TaxID=2496818 RepID=UPI001D0DD5CE|nr:ribonuclease III [Candidatus Magnetaquicoccus inordinatus]